MVDMDTKQYLGQISRLDRKINSKLCEISELRSIACGTSVQNDADRVQTSSDKDRLGSIVAKIVDLEHEVDEMTDDLYGIKLSALGVLEKIERENYREILYLKYFEGKSIYDIAVDLNMSDRGCKKAHKRALEEFEKYKM